MAAIQQYGKTAADQLATATHRGLLGPTDFTKLQTLLYDAHGNVLLTGPNSTTGGFVGRESRLTGPQQDVHLRSGTAAGSLTFVESEGGTFATANAYWDGTVWNRYNTGRAASRMQVDGSGSKALWAQFADAGANPIVWQDILWFRTESDQYSRLGVPNTNASIPGMIIEGGIYLFAGGNAYYTGGVWNRYNTSSPAVVIRVGQDGTFTLMVAAAGANPISSFTTYAMSPSSLGTLVNPPRTRMFAAAAQSLPTATWTAVSFNTTLNNTGGAPGTPMWSAGLPTRFTAPITGRYDLGFNGGFAQSATGSMRIWGIRANGATFINTDYKAPFSAASPMIGGLHMTGFFNAGDYAEFMLYQDTGGALNTAPIAYYSGVAWMSYIGDI